MRPYTHFTATERESLRVMRSENKSMHAIARKLGRNVSSISREVKRNSNRDGSYNVWRAISCTSIGGNAACGNKGFWWIPSCVSLSARIWEALVSRSDRH